MNFEQGLRESIRELANKNNMTDKDIVLIGIKLLKGENNE